MKREKTIGVSFQCNTKLKKKTEKRNGQLKDVYPLYVTVVYDGNNTQFRAVINEESIYVTEEMDILDDPTRRVQLENYANEIRNIVRLELKKYGDDFIIRGFSKRFSLYARSVGDIIGQTVLKVFDDYFRPRGYKFGPVPISEVNVEKSISRILMYEHREMTVLDWMLLGGKSKIIELSKERGATKEDIDLDAGLVDYLINRHL